MSMAMIDTASQTSATDGGLYDEALATFFVEAREMLEQIETSLLVLENAPDDRDTINALFRAAHTIKGSAGLFGLERIVGFTHQVESVLDSVRRGVLQVDQSLSDTLLKSCDVMLAMLSQEEQKIKSPEGMRELDVEACAISQRLRNFLGPQEVPVTGLQAGSGTPDAVATSASEAVSDVWHLSLRFGQQALRNGFDPISVIQYLGTIGIIVTLIVVDQALPDLASMDAESCYLGFEIRLQTSASQQIIDGAFDFVRDDCTVRIFSPLRQAAELISLLETLPDERRLGDLLVECGALTRSALDEALIQQGRHAEQHSSRKPIGEILVEQHQLQAEVLDAALNKQGKQRERKVDDARYVRVHADKLDALINQVGELVICGASASLQAQTSRQPQMLETTQRMSGLVEEIRNGALALRMVQIGETFNRYRRVVRDTAAELGKEIVLDIEGADTELDKSVIEKIGDPLMHLVRNAMDHGIELPAQRLAAGKSAHGTLCLSAHHDSGYIVIQVRDDGKGLDGDMLLSKARERGLVNPNHLLSDAEKLHLIFEPGFSTAEKVTNLSGRGVGMDVVKKNIEALRGKVLLKSEVGCGTTIEIRLPLTLAIIDGFLVRVGNSSYVIPLDAVVECIDAHADLLRASDHWAGHVDVRGELLPYLELRAIFGVTESAPARRSIVVVKNHDTTAGLVVDQLQGEYQTVIKPLGRLFQQLRGISGSTVLGSGEVALILDVPALVKLATEHSKQEARMCS